MKVATITLKNLDDYLTKPQRRGGPGDQAHRAQPQSRAAGLSDGLSRESR